MYKSAIALSIFFFFGCNNSKVQPVVLIQSDLKGQLTEEYCFISAIEKNQESTYIIADYIQFLEGNEAIQVAKARNEADIFRLADGSIKYGVPNDYFIVNENKKLRRLRIAKDAAYDLLIDNLDRFHPISTNDLNSLVKIYKDNPFVLTLKDGVIIKVKEVFIP
jgi:hypothetical protein